MTRALLVLLVAACGDDRVIAERFEPTSGTRLKLEQYQFDDGTRQLEPDAFYDVRLHARCTPRPWIDGELRCVPDADAAVYTDAACTMAVGLARTIDEPTHFIGYLGGERERIWATGPDTDPIDGFYERRENDECAGPFSVPPPEDPEDEVEIFELANEIGGEELVPFTERELGDGRIGLVVRETEEGVRVPLGLRDRELDLPCVPSATQTCTPEGAIAAREFADPACTQPVIVVPDDATPTLASVTSADGCTQTFHRIGAAAPARRYRRSGDACTVVPGVPSQRVLFVGPEVALAPLPRTIAEGSGRLRSIVAGEDPIAFGDLERLYDTSTRAECRRQQIDDRLRCVPAALAPIVALYRAGCTIELRVAHVPARACTPYAFGAFAAFEGLELHALGDVLAVPPYQQTFAGCQPYTAPTDVVLHAVGPVLPPETFVGAVAFGER